MPHDIAVIRELVSAALSEEELRVLCFDHFHAIYEQFAAGQTKGQRVLALVDYADRQILLDDLLARVKTANPRKYAEFEPRLGPRRAGRRLPPENLASPSVASPLPGRISLAVSGSWPLWIKLGPIRRRTSSAWWRGAGWASPRW